jgi:hypothetical protein
VSSRRLALLALACAAAGAALMVLVDSPWALGAGVALLIAFIAIGAAAIATPEYLGRDDDWQDEERG